MRIAALAGIHPASPIERHGWLLALATLACFAGTALYHVPLGLMALGGVIGLSGSLRAFRADPSVRFIAAVFLCLWIPQLVALPWAAVPEESLRVAGRYLLYPLAAVFMARVVGVGDRFSSLALGIAIVTAVWGVDMVVGAAGLQLGPPPAPDDYVGGTLFGRHTLGHVAAVASPFVFELIRRRHREAPWLWVVPVLLVLLVLLSGRRVAWMMMLVAGVAYAGYLVLASRRIRWRWLVLVPALLLGASVLATTLHSPTEERVLLTLDLLSPDRDEVDTATSWRLDIWATASTTARESWPMGVGARGFRHVYADHAAPDDFWLQEGRTGAYHPHQIVLEIAAETGLAGLLGYVLLWALLGLAALRSRGPWVWPAALSVAVAVFPLNAHDALYSSYWSAVTWWSVGLFAAAIATPLSRAADPGPPLRNGGGRSPVPG